MPGLKQLQQFNSDIMTLGDEAKIRAARGEKPVFVSIPKNVQDIDDSDEFLDGLPMLSEEEQQMMYLYYMKHKTFNEIADQLGYSEIGIAKMHQRIIKKIRKYI